MLYPEAFNDSLCINSETYYFSREFFCNCGDIVSDAFLKSKPKDLITEINEYFDFKKLFYLRKVFLAIWFF